MNYIMDEELRNFMVVSSARLTAIEKDLALLKRGPAKRSFWPRLLWGDRRKKEKILGDYR